MSGRYKYNSKEIDQATGMYYYGARYYDPRLSIFVSVDPLAEVQPDKTPYHFVSNNPITRVDPTGMADHDYRLNSDGTISEKPIRETNSPLDRLILFDDNGKETDCSIDIEKGILNNVKRNVLNDLEKKYSYFKVNNNKDAKDIFEFLSENTKVEWGHISFGKTSNYIATSNYETQENGGIHLIKNLIEKKYSVNFYIHSHPDDGKQYRYYGPSGGYSRYDKLQKGQGDQAVAEYIQKLRTYYKYSKQIKLGVYEATIRQYIYFDQNKILK